MPNFEAQGQGHDGVAATNTKGVQRCHQDNRRSNQVQELGYGPLVQQVALHGDQEAIQQQITYDETDAESCSPIHSPTIQIEQISDVAAQHRSGFWLHLQVRYDALLELWVPKESLCAVRPQRRHQEAHQPTTSR